MGHNMKAIFQSVWDEILLHSVTLARIKTSPMFGRLNLVAEIHYHSCISNIFNLAIMLPNISDWSFN